jgi:hypothetical protein
MVAIAERRTLQKTGAALRAGAQPAARSFRRFFFATPHVVPHQSRYPRIDADDDSAANILTHADAGFMRGGDFR